LPRKQFPYSNKVKMALVLLILLLTSLVAALNADKLRLSFRALGGNEQVFNEWLLTMQNGAELPIESRLQKINNYINRKILYTDDIEAWGQSDYWATPLESLAKGKGDCEDYVIAKYFSLRNMNIPDNQLRLIYVKARIGGANSTIQQAHMVLAYYPAGEAEPLILDNLISDIRAASRRTDLTPIFSFNGQGVFAGAASNSNVGPGGTSRLSRWQDLLERARKEGFE
jgi:predicted transglutaminase-like cysteine proteinase